jgi:hypothetical protein
MTALERNQAAAMVAARFVLRAVSVLHSTSEDRLSFHVLR